MISFSYNVRISLRQDYVPPPSLFDFQARATPLTGPRNFLSPLGESDPRTPLWEAILPSKEDSPASPVVEYGLTLEDLSERVVTPLKGLQHIRLDGRTIPFGGMERIEIRAEGTDLEPPSSPNRLLDLLRRFEWSGTDVTGEFIKDPPAWGPKIGAPERPDMIPVDLLFDRLVTNNRLSQAARTRFRSRNFADAVEAAFKCLDNAVRDRSGLSDKGGSDLMFTVFNEKNPILKLNELHSPSDRNEQEGYKHLFAGAMTGIRNPRAHEHELRDDPKVALEILAFANHLMNKLDAATRKETESSEPTP